MLEHGKIIGSKVGTPLPPEHKKHDCHSFIVILYWSQIAMSEDVYEQKHAKFKAVK